MKTNQYIIIYNYHYLIKINILTYELLYYLNKKICVDL